MERIKDILYDISDNLIIFLIIILMFSIISFKINNSLPFAETILGDPDASISKNVENNQPDLINATTIANSNQDREAEEITAIKPELQTEGASSDAESGGGEIITIIIPSGATALSIAETLEKSGLIVDKNDFMLALEKDNLANKLQAGSFEFHKGMSIDEIISTLVQK